MVNISYINDKCNIFNNDLHFSINENNIDENSILKYKTENETNEQAYVRLLKDILKTANNHDIHYYAWGTIDKNDSHYIVSKTGVTGLKIIK